MRRVCPDPVRSKGDAAFLIGASPDVSCRNLYDRHCLPVADRRFVPVDCTDIGRHLLPGAVLIARDDVLQIWAEAKTWYDAGEIPVIDAQYRDEITALNEGHTFDDPWVYKIADYLNIPITPAWYEKSLENRRTMLHQYQAGVGSIQNIMTVPRQCIVIADIWEECFERSLDTIKREERHLHAAMQQVPGWELTGQRRYNGKPQRCVYARIPDTNNDKS